MADTPRIIPAAFRRGDILERIAAVAHQRREVALAFADAWRAAGGAARADGPVVHVDAPAGLSGRYVPDGEAVHALRTGGLAAAGPWRARDPAP